MTEEQAEIELFRLDRELALKVLDHAERTLSRLQAANTEAFGAVSDQELDDAGLEVDKARSDHKACKLKHQQLLANYPNKEDSCATS